MKEFISSDTGFILFALIPAIPWLVAMYWQILLYKRIQLVSRSQDPIPENINWMERASLAKSIDAKCQKYTRNKNITGVVFLAIIFIEFVIAITALL